MILPDVNLLLYALDERSRRHEAARSWLDQALSGSETVAFAWSVLLAFLRLATSRSLFDLPMTIDEAIEVLQGWLAQPVAVVVEPTERHLILLRQLLEPLGTGGNLVPDAHIAALAIEHGAELHSSDADFQRFPGLRWRDPLRG